MELICRCKGSKDETKLFYGCQILSHDKGQNVPCKTEVQCRVIILHYILQVFNFFLITWFIFNFIAQQRVGLFLIHWPLVMLKSPPLDPHAGLELNYFLQQIQLTFSPLLCASLGCSSISKKERKKKRVKTKIIFNSNL